MLIRSRGPIKFPIGSRGREQILAYLCQKRSVFGLRLLQRPLQNLVLGLRSLLLGCPGASPFCICWKRTGAALVVALGWYAALSWRTARAGQREERRIIIGRGGSNHTNHSYQTTAIIYRWLDKG